MYDGLKTSTALTTEKRYQTIWLHKFRPKAKTWPYSLEEIHWSNDALNVTLNLVTAGLGFGSTIATSVLLVSWLVSVLTSSYLGYN